VTPAGKSPARPVRIIAIGDEPLEGRTSDTNSRRIQQALGGHAVRCETVQVVPDDLDAVAQALELTREGDLVFVSGGLGSTPDDMSREAVAGWAGVDLIEDPDLRAALTERWRRRGITTTRGIGPQCEVPAGMVPVTNPVGSAPGLVGPLRGRTVAMLPGVPAELEGLLPGVISRLELLGALPAALPARMWRTAQVSELSLVRRLEPVQETFGNLRWSWWLTDWGVDMRLADPRPGSDGAELALAAGDVEEVLGHLVYSCDPETLPEVVQRLMVERGTTVAVAESCTAGLIGGHLTEQAGSSGFFRGGIQAYADDVKRDLLGVPSDALLEHGAVSGPTVLAMAEGARSKLGADHGLAVSGISGPGGGTDLKPVGTTWVGIATPAGAFAQEYRFPGDRSRNRLLTVAAAVDSLRRALEFGPGVSPWREDDPWCRPR